MIDVIGFHHRDLLPPFCLKIIQEARVLVGGRRHLASFPEFEGPKIELQSPLEKALEKLKEFSSQRVALLASGDPLFFGIGKRLLSLFPPEKLRFHPAPTAFQLAFARAQIPWEEARIISFHGREAWRNLHLEIAPYGVVAFLTDPLNTPSRIASYLLEKGLEGQAVVCENLALPEERIFQLPLEAVAEKEFAPLNVFILRKSPAPRRFVFGLPEENFAREGGLITKDFLRSQIIAALSPFREAVVWDLGAGSGAVGLELASICFKGEAYLVEKSPSRLSLIEKNLKRFKLDNVHIVPRPLEVALEALPPPDLVFIGGGFQALYQKKETFLSKVKSSTRICATFVCLENLIRALELFEKEGFRTKFDLFSVSRGKRLANGAYMLAAENPVFLLKAWRER